MDPRDLLSGVALLGVGILIGHFITMKRMRTITLTAMKQQFMEMAHVQNIVINSCRHLAGTAYLSTPQYLAAVREVAKAQYDFDLQFHQPGDPR